MRSILPTLSIKSRTNVSDSASPAKLIVRTVDGTARMRNNSRIADGTVLIKVKWVVGDSSGKANAFSTSTAVPPLLRVANISNTDRSKQIEVDASTRAR